MRVKTGETCRGFQGSDCIGFDAIIVQEMGKNCDLCQRKHIGNKKYFTREHCELLI